MHLAAQRGVEPRAFRLEVEELGGDEEGGEAGGNASRVTSKLCAECGGATYLGEESETSDMAALRSNGRCRVGPS